MSHVNPSDDLIDITVRMPRALVQRAMVPAERLAIASVILNDRRERRSLFPGVKFGDPSWDMMLDLYIAHHSGGSFDISGLCAVSGVPITTALRHIERLVAHGYMVRSDDPHDGRRTFLLASDRMLHAIDSWVDLHLDHLTKDEH
jgi:hypothetical protein